MTKPVNSTDFITEDQLVTAENLLNHPERATHVNEVLGLVVIKLAEQIGLDYYEIELHRSVNISLGDSVYVDNFVDSTELKEFFGVTDLDDNIASLSPRQIAVHICQELGLDTGPSKKVKETNGEQAITPQLQR